MPPVTVLSFRQKFRRCFRWCRITSLFLVLLLLGGLVYLNRVGLPEFLKVRLVSELRARGVDLNFTRLRLREGRLVLPLISSNRPPEQFVVNGIVTELHLLPEDRWELDHFQAFCLGAKINLSGTLANASAVRDWQFARGTNQPPGLWQTQLRQAVKIAKQMHFGRPPEIMVTVNGDARVPASISVELRLRAREADTSWGKLEKLLLIARLNQPSGSNEV